MTLIITTLGRLNDQTTLHHLSTTEMPVTLVVQAHEYAEHKAKYHRHNVYALPPEIDNLGPTREYIIKNWEKFSATPKIILLDDDLQFYYRPDPEKWNLKNAQGFILEKMFQAVYLALDHYVHASVSAREGNNRIEAYAAENTRYMRLLAYNAEKIPAECRADRVNGMSDFDLNLQLLRRGHKSLTFFNWAQGQKGTQAPGGCSMNRTHETHNAEVQYMSELHEGFVRQREKNNKTGGDFGKRMELTVYWKKAFESSQNEAE